MALAPDTKSLALTLIDGVRRTFLNADELYDEAMYLAQKGATARALLLHQISLEECGKAHMLFVTISALLRGEEVDVMRVIRASTRHGVKNKTNAYFLPMSESETEAQQKNDFSMAHTAFTEMQHKFHRESNELKNTSLYVDFDERFISPRDVINSDMVADIQQRNAMFMAMTVETVAVLARWEADLDAAADELAELSAVMGIDALDRSDPKTLQNFKDSLEAKLAELVERRKGRSSDGTL